MQHRHPNSPIVQLLARCSAMSVAALCTAHGTDPVSMEQMLLDMQRIHRIELLRPIGLADELGPAARPEDIYVRLIRPSDEDYLWELELREREHEEAWQARHARDTRENQRPADWHDYRLLPWATA